MVNFEKGKIYSIRSYQTDQVYIGSTTQTLAQRLGKHRGTYRSWKDGRRSIITSSKEILKYDDHYIELVEMYPCNNKDELHRREGEIIRATPNCVNTRIAGRTSKEYYEDNKESIVKKNKEYQQKNKEHIRQYKKEWFEKNKESIAKRTKEYAEKNKESIAKKKKEYAEKNKEHIRQYQKEYREKNKESIAKKKKEYYEDNKESIANKKKEYAEKNKEHIRQYQKEYHQKNKGHLKQYKKEWVEKNKDIIKQKRSKKIICECGAELGKYMLPRHKRTKKHQFYQQTYDFIHS